MSTDTRPTSLIINELTEAQLEELKNNNNIPPNEIFFTDDDETSPRGLPLGTIVPVAVISDDASLHLLDGSSLIQNGIYKQFCDWLKARVLANSASVPTCTIAEYASEMTTYGQCGKFVINDTSSDQSSNGYTVYANSIKLPTITEFIASNNGGDTIGLAELDMFKEHTHYVPLANSVVQDTNNTYYPNWDYQKAVTSGVYSYGTGGDETRPKNVRYPYYIVVASSVKTDIEVDIDNVVSDINAINDILNKTEQVETVYDMHDSTKDWGYSGGLAYNTSFSNKDFSKYKKLILYARWGDNAAAVGVLDLLHEFSAHGNTYQTNVNNKSISSSDPDTYWFIVSVSTDKTTINMEKAGYDNFTERKICGESTSLTAHIMRIEGVY